MNVDVIGKKLKSLRIKNDYDIEAIQKILNKRKVNYSVSTIYKWEEGGVLPSVEVVDILCEIYGCTLSYLFESDIVDNKNLTSCEIFLLEQFRYNDNFRKIATLIYRLYLREPKTKAKKKSKNKK